MLSLFAFSIMLTAVAPQNEERDDDLVAASILVVVGTTATGALLGAVLAGGSSFLAFADACAQQACVDNPQFIVTPLATAGGAVVGAMGGGLLGIGLMDALRSSRRSSTGDEREFRDELPDE